MTILETLVKHCEDNGMFPGQAVQVVQRLESDPTMESMQGRWKDDVQGYPQQMLAVLIVNLNRVAVEWIDSNIPQAWFRPMFDMEARHA